MRPKRKAVPKIERVANALLDAASVPQAPVDSPAVVPAEPWYRSIVTDRNREFDTGRLLVNVVILTMCTIALIHGSDKFDYQSFGIGIGSVLGGFAAYLFGDAQRPPPTGPTTTTSIQKVQTTTP